MCGIVLSIRPSSSSQVSSSANPSTSSIPVDQSTSFDREREWEALTATVADRGPDYSQTLTVESADSAYTLTFHATVLHLRGEQVTPQPFTNERTGDILCWNGEIFDSPSLPVGYEENDGKKLFSLIESVGFFEAMKRLDGPHAFIYYSKAEDKIYFTRDCLGRRSLLRRKRNRRGEFVLTSTAPPRTEHEGEEDAWVEISCEGIWELDLKVLASGEGEKFLRLHKRFYESEAPSSEALTYPFDRLNRSLPTIGSLLPMTRSFPPLPVLSKPYLSLISTFKSLLLESIRQRVLTIPFNSRSSSPSKDSEPKPRIAILFSGGLDCTSLALLVDEVLPREEGIDLINVSFENPRKLQLATGGQRKEKKRKETKKERQDRLKREENGEPEPVVQEAEETNESNAQGEPQDSTIPSEPASMYDVPDRMTGLETWGELCRLRPHRRWNFVKVDVPYQEMIEHRQRVIDLMKPQDTVMDLSIAVAFYFAARGQGTLAPPRDATQASSSTPYTSTARVLLSGLGADELLGGYSRHRKAYNQYQSFDPSLPSPPPDSPEGHARWTSLIDELQMDLSRISTRNLGRDDRIISSHSKEVRYPFLTTPVVRFLSDLPVWEKCDLRFEEGLGDKILLRMLVRDLMRDESREGERMNGNAWRLKKRAIHFGARTAKMELETGRAKGTDRL
ncbi:putative asparagine synthase [Sporobolomyces salmoneus]|uniref:putative asparagine synthase n=1 Tax=Sporobolomyces salmoneus TaxID=183962 RepID=UPI00317C0269